MAEPKNLNDLIDEIAKLHSIAAIGAISAHVIVNGEPHDVHAIGILMARVMAQATPESIPILLKYAIKDWAPLIEAEIAEIVPQMPPPGGTGAFLPPAPPGAPVPPISDMIPAPPEYLTEIEREAWIQAKTRSLEYVKNMEEPLKVRLRTIVSDAVDEAIGSSELAHRLAREAQDFSYNWHRIARTELQAVYNEGIVIEALRWDGPDALIARVPESDACIHCKRLLLAADGTPMVFTARELIDNGTNVGVKAIDWKPTIWPIHPNCRCGTQAVPMGFEFDEEWNLVLAV